MNYIDAIVKKLDEKIPGCETELLLFYALLVFAKGENCTSKDIHDAWSCWCTTVKKEHRSLIPFDELTDNIKLFDVPYANAVREVAKESL